MEALPSAVTAKSTLTPSTPLLTVKGPDAIASEARAKETPAPVRDFKSLLSDVWKVNREAKTSTAQEDGLTIQDRILANLRARHNRIDPAAAAKIKAAVGGSVRRLNITGVKCRQADAWTLDLFSSADKPWRLNLSTVPEPTPEVLANAASAVLAAGGDGVAAVADAREAVAGAMHESLITAEKVLRDRLDAADLTGVLLSVVPDMTTAKGGIIKGPLAGPDKSVRFCRVSPLDAFPASGATGFDDGDFVERFKIERGEVEKLLDAPGYDAGALRKVLATWDTVLSDDLGDATVEERERLERASSPDRRQYAWGRDFWVRVSGETLKKMKCEAWMKAPRDIDPLKTYDMNALMIGGELVYLGENTDYAGRRPYRKAGWDKVDGSFFYDSLPEQLEDVAAIMTNATRGLLNNLAWVQGPCVEVDMDRIPPGEPISHVPMRTWQMRSRGQTSPAVRYDYHESMISEYLSVFSTCFSLADQISDIPSYAFGDDKAAGAGRTFGGLSLLMNGANRGFKRFLLGIANDLQTPLINDTLVFMRDRLKVPELKIPDPEVKPCGVVAMMARDTLADRRLAFLDRINQEGAGDIISPSGKAAIYRELAESMEIKGLDLIRPADELAEIDRSKLEAARAESAAKAAEAQARAQESQVKVLEIQAKIQEGQTRTQIEYMKVQLEMQRAAADSQRQERELRLKEINSQLAIKKLELEQAKMQKDTAIELEELSDARELKDAKVVKDRAAAARHQIGVAKDAIELQGGQA